MAIPSLMSYLGQGAKNFGVASVRAPFQVGKGVGTTVNDNRGWLLGTGKVGGNQNISNKSSELASKGILGLTGKVPGLNLMANHFKGQGGNLFRRSPGDGYGIFKPSAKDGSGEAGEGSEGSDSGLKTPAYHFHDNTSHYYMNNNRGNIAIGNHNVQNIGNNSNTGNTGMPSTPSAPPAFPKPPTPPAPPKFPTPPVTAKLTRTVVANPFPQNAQPLVNGKPSPSPYRDPALGTNLINHMKNQYVQDHIDAYQPQNTNATKPGFWDTTPSFSNERPPAKPQPLPFRKEILSKPQIDRSKAEVPSSFNPNQAKVQLDPSENPETAGPSFGMKPPKPGVNMKNPMNQVAEKANKMLPYINDVYAHEPENVRMALAIDAAFEFFKTAADVMDAAPPEVAPVNPKKYKEYKTVGADHLAPHVHPDALQASHDELSSILPGFSGVDGAMRGQATGDNGVSTQLIPPFQIPEAKYNELSPKPHLRQKTVTKMFGGWHEKAKEHLGRVAAGETDDDILKSKKQQVQQRQIEKAQAPGAEDEMETVLDYDGNPMQVKKKPPRPVGDVVQEFYNKENQHAPDVPPSADEMEPITSDKVMNINDQQVNLPRHKQQQIDTLLGQLRSGINPMGRKMSKSERGNFLSMYNELTPHLTDEQRLSQLPPGLHEDYAKAVALKKAKDDAAIGVRRDKRDQNEPVAAPVQASKLNELRIITAGMNSYEIEAVADGLLNSGYSVDDILKVASEGEDINGSTHTVEDVTKEYGPKEVPDYIKWGFH